MAIASLFYEGILDAYPKLKICVSHGGGYMPYYMGRIARNYLEKPATRVNMSKSPAEYLRMLYFDSCVYETEVLEALVKRVGADRVLLGSDYPVGEPKPIEFIEFCALSRRRRRTSSAATPRACSASRSRREVYGEGDGAKTFFARRLHFSRNNPMQSTFPSWQTGCAC